MNVIWAHIHESIKARASEFTLGLILLAMSAVLAFNTTLFADQVAIYRGFMRYLDQPSWALLCAVVGGVRLVVLSINGFWHRSPLLRAICAYISCGVWILLSSGVYASGTYGLGLAIYPVLLLSDSYNVLRTTGDAREADRRRRHRLDGRDTRAH